MSHWVYEHFFYQFIHQWAPWLISYLGYTILLLRVSLLGNLYRRLSPSQVFLNAPFFPWMGQQTSLAWENIPPPDRLGSAIALPLENGPLLRKILWEHFTGIILPSLSARAQGDISQLSLICWRSNLWKCGCLLHCAPGKFLMLMIIRISSPEFC